MVLGIPGDIPAPLPAADEGPDEFPRMELGDKLYLKWKPVAAMDTPKLVMNARVVCAGARACTVWVRFESKQHLQVLQLSDAHILSWLHPDVVEAEPEQKRLLAHAVELMHNCVAPTSHRFDPSVGMELQRERFSALHIGELEFDHVIAMDDCVDEAEAKRNAEQLLKLPQHTQRKPVDVAAQRRDYRKDDCAQTLWGVFECVACSNSPSGGVQFFDVTSSSEPRASGLYWSEDRLHLYQLGGAHTIESSDFSIALGDLRLRPLRHGSEILKHAGQPMYEGTGVDGQPIYLFFSHRIHQAHVEQRGVWLVDSSMPLSPMSHEEFVLRKSELLWFADAIGMFENRRNVLLKTGLPLGSPRRGGTLEGLLKNVDIRWVLKKSDIGAQMIELDECVTDGEKVPLVWPKIRVRAKVGRAFDSYQVNVYWDEASASWLDREWQAPTKVCRCGLEAHCQYVGPPEPNFPSRQGAHPAELCPDCFWLGDSCYRMDNRTRTQAGTLRSSRLKILDGKKVQCVPRGLLVHQKANGIHYTVVVVPRVVCYPKEAWELGHQGQQALGETARKRWEPGSSSQKIFEYAWRLSRGCTQSTGGAQAQLLQSNLLGALQFCIAKGQREDPNAGWVHHHDAASNADNAADPGEARRRVENTVCAGFMVGAITESINHAGRTAADVLGAKNAIAKLFAPTDLVPNEPEFKLGWAWYPIIAEEERSQLQREGWIEAYHGTGVMNVASIISDGFKLPKHQEEILHGDAGGGGISHVYTSLSLEYAAHPVYAKFLKLKEDNCVLQLVFQVLVRDPPARVQGNTLLERHWPRDLPIDPAADPNRLELLSADAADVKVTDMLIRLLGPTVDERFGELARKLKNPCQKQSEYRWTRMLQQHLRAAQAEL